MRDQRGLSEVASVVSCRSDGGLGGAWEEGTDDRVREVGLVCRMLREQEAHTGRLLPGRRDRRSARDTVGIEEDMLRLSITQRSC